MTTPFAVSPSANDSASDVLDGNNAVHVQSGAADLAESLEHSHESTFLPDVPDWDRPDHGA